MRDDKGKTDRRDRMRVAVDENYEVNYLAKEARITREQARDLIERYGNDREMLMKHARNLT